MSVGELTYVYTICQRESGCWYYFLFFLHCGLFEAYCCNGSYVVGGGGSGCWWWFHGTPWIWGTAHLTLSVVGRSDIQTHIKLVGKNVKPTEGNEINKQTTNEPNM